jgi:hypothetical protein
LARRNCRLPFANCGLKIADFNVQYSILNKPCLPFKLAGTTVRQECSRKMTGLLAFFGALVL